MSDESVITCVICNKEFAVNKWFWGHNPSPLFDEGKCCNKCNTEVVNMERIRRVMANTMDYGNDDNKAMLQAM